MRIFDLLFASIGLILSIPISATIFILCLFDTGSPIFIQTRVGKHKKPFRLLKFRTMRLETESVASHLASSSSVTRLGKILRRTKLDELPQLINVLMGQMSLVGPRPNLYNQQQLIKEREDLDVYDVLPGITGLAQIRNIDMSTPELLARTDKQMIETLTLSYYFYYIFKTVSGDGTGDAVNK